MGDRNPAALTARAGFRNFESTVRKAHVVELKKTEAPTSRIVNANSGSAAVRGGDLHASCRVHDYAELIPPRLLPGDDFPQLAWTTTLWLQVARSA